MKITLPKRTRSPWPRGFREALLQLPEASEGRVEQSPVSRHALTVDVNGKRVLIACWDYDMGVVEALKSDDIDLILQVQYTGDQEGREHFGKRVQPFVMFAPAMSRFHQNIDISRAIVADQENRFRVGWSGRRWKDSVGRAAYIDYLQEKEWADIECIPGQATGAGLDWPDYCVRLGTWEWSLILRGKGSKWAMGNRREHECGALGIPMVLNYKPVYYDPLDHGVHYKYVEEPGNLDGLDEMMNETRMNMIAAARDYWQRNQSPEGIGNLFKRICEEQL